MFTLFKVIISVHIVFKGYSNYNVSCKHKHKHKHKGIDMTKEERIKEARAKYAREWRKKNPDKAKAIADRYWEKKAAENDKTRQ